MLANIESKWKIIFLPYISFPKCDLIFCFHCIILIYDIFDANDRNWYLQKMKEKYVNEDCGKVGLVWLKALGSDVFTDPPL